MATESIDTARALPVRDWVTRLMQAVAVMGYATVDLRSQPGPQMVSPQQLVGAAQNGFSGLPGGWAQLPDHIQVLKALGAESVAMRAHRRQLLVVIGRTEPSVNIESVAEYFRGIELWYRTLAALLPRLEANDDEKAAIATVSKLVGGVVGPAAAPIASKLLTALIEASNGGSGVTVHVYVNASALASNFAATDLESLPAGGIGNRNWLWEADNGRIAYSAALNDSGVGPPFKVQELAAAIASTNG